MHKYFDFKKIFEAEQEGAPLSPEEMGTPSAEQSAPAEGEKEVIDFESLKGPLTVVITKDDLTKLKEGALVKSANWAISPDNEADFKSVKVVIKNTDAATDAEVADKDITDSIMINLSQQQMNDLNIEDPNIISSKEVNGIAGEKQIEKINLKIVKDFSDVTAQEPAEAKPEKETEQIEASSESIEPKKILSFDQFVNEKKNEWIADVVKGMDKGALRKEMKKGKDEKISLVELVKSEAKLKKKDKDKKEPGLQLDPKDAKTHKRNVLAKNLINAAKGKK